MRHALALSLALLLPPAAAAQEILDLSYVALRKLEVAEYSAHEMKSLRSGLEERRDHLIDACKKEEERLKNEIGGARKKLNEMNGLSSRDTGSMAGVRSGLHAAIAAAASMATLRISVSETYTVDSLTIESDQSPRESTYSPVGTLPLLKSMRMSLSTRYAMQSLSLGLAPILADAVHVLNTSPDVVAVLPHPEEP